MASPIEKPTPGPPRNPRHARHEVHQTAELRVALEPGGEPQWVEGTVLDISFTGVRLACPHAATPGEEVALRLLCNKVAQQQVPLVVRWSRELDAGGYHLGMQFVTEGELLPMLGLDSGDLASDMDPGGQPVGPSAPYAGRLEFTQAAKVGKIERLHCSASDDLSVEQGLCESYLQVHGALTIQEGGLVGGETRVSKRITAGQVGSASETPTKIVLGYLPDDIANVYTRALRKLEQNTAKIAEAQAKIDSFSGKDGDGTHEQREAMTAMMFEMQMQESGADELREKIELLDGLISRKTQPELSVAEALHPGVTVGLHFGGQSYETTQHLPGPVLIRCNEQRELVLVAEDGSETALDACEPFKRSA